MKVPFLLILILSALLGHFLVCNFTDKANTYIITIPHYQKQKITQRVIEINPPRLLAKREEEIFR